jgi:hypothetical protein
MKKVFTGKGVVLIAAFVVAAIAAIAGYAYFTAHGSGTGSARVGTATPISLSGTTSPSDFLYPGGPSIPVDIAVTNNSDGAQGVFAVRLDSVTDNDNTGDCDTTVFTMPPVLVRTDIALHDTLHVTGQLSMADNVDNQDGCQGDALVLNLSSN